MTWRSIMTTKARQIATLAKRLYTSAQEQRTSCGCTALAFEDTPDTVKAFYVRLACDVIDHWPILERFELTA